MKFKKGELSTQQIVLLIVLITSFAIILFFLVRLNLGGESEKEICHNSVAMQSLPSAATSTPLKCSRDYICITQDKTCEGMLNPEKIKVKSMNDIYDSLAKEMANCWWMFGEGKIDYIGGKFGQRNYCSICSQILLDDSLKDIKEGTPEELEELKQGKISKDRLYNYMSNNNLSKDKTYSEYLFGTNDIQELKKQVLENQDAQGTGTFGTMDIGEDNQQFVVMGIVSEQGWMYYALGAGIVVVGVFTPVGWIASAVIIGAGIGTGTLGGEIAGSFEPEIAALMVRGDGIPNQFMAPTIQEANSTKFDLLNCYDIVTST